MRQKILVHNRLKKSRKKRFPLKIISHEQWDLMDFWVELYWHCKFIAFPEKFTLSKLFSTIHSNKDQTVSSYLGDNLCGKHQRSLQLKSIAISLTHT